MLLMMLMERIVSDPIHRRTMLTSWFEANQIFEDARELTYCDFHQNGGGMNRARYEYVEKGEKERLAKYIMFIHP
jgi:hypothetical protein